MTNIHIFERKMPHLEEIIITEAYKKDEIYEIIYIMEMKENI